MEIKEVIDYDLYNQQVEEIVEKVGNLYCQWSTHLQKEKIEHLNNVIGELLKAGIEDYEMEEELK